MTPSKIIADFFAGTPYLITVKRYPSPLPADLDPWYCYTSDGGHSILALIEDHFEENSEDLVDDLCPCPVKTALRDYRMFKGFPVVKAIYDQDLGLIVPEGDNEY